MWSIGVRVSVAAFLLAAIDRGRERRRQATSLLILGTPRRILATAEIVQNTMTVAIVAVLGGAAYDTAGAVYGWFGAGLGTALGHLSLRGSFGRTGPPRCWPRA